VFVIPPPIQNNDLKIIGSQYLAVSLYSITASRDIVDFNPNAEFRDIQGAQAVRAAAAYGLYRTAIFPSLICHYFAILGKIIVDNGGGGSSL
jgi:hypothetical protein